MPDQITNSPFDKRLLERESSSLSQVTLGFKPGTLIYLFLFLNSLGGNLSARDLKSDNPSAPFGNKKI